MVLSVCHKVLIYSQCILIFPRVESLCMIRLVALGSILVDLTLAEESWWLFSCWFKFEVFSLFD